MKSTQIVQLSTVFPVSDIAESTRWYHEFFGFETVYLHEGTEEGEVTNYAVMRSGNIELSLILDEAMPQPRHWTQAGTGYLCFDVSDVDVAFAELKSKGATITRELQTEPWGSRRFLLTDPSGNEISVSQAD